MNREEIKNRLYFVADTIRMNADKFAAGETLENEDWVKAAKEFTSCLNYLMQSQRDFEEVRAEEEPHETPSSRNVIRIDVPVNFEHNGRRYRIAESEIDRFMGLPVELRPASMGTENEEHSPSVNGDVPRKVGEVASIAVDPVHGLVAQIDVDSHKYRFGQILKTLIQGGYAPKFTLCGELEEDFDHVMKVVKLTHISIDVPPAFGASKPQEADNG